MGCNKYRIEKMLKQKENVKEVKSLSRAFIYLVLIHE